MRFGPNEIYRYRYLSGASLTLPRRKALLIAFLLMIGENIPKLSNWIEEGLGNSSKKVKSL
jgi:hypothetical protein